MSVRKGKEESLTVPIQEADMVTKDEVRAVPTNIGNFAAMNGHTNMICHQSPSSSMNDVSEMPDIPTFSGDFVREQEELLRQFANIKMKGSDERPRTDHEDSIAACSARNCSMPGMEGLGTSAFNRRNEEEDFSALLQDQALIEEQRRIFEQFQVQKSAARIEPNHSTRNLYPGSSRTNMIRRDGHCTTKGSTQLDSHVNDHTTRIGNQNLRVKGTRHAYESISNGTAVVVQCSFCQAILQVGATAKLLYCSHCHEVTPMEVARSVSADLIGATDHDIAAKIQVQEIDVASEQKLASLQNERRAMSVVARTRPKHLYSHAP